MGRIEENTYEPKYNKKYFEKLDKLISRKLIYNNGVIVNNIDNNTK